MSEKRRDKRGRILKDGEYQRPDGRYEYKFVDIFGNRQAVYSWKLVETDKVPRGKRDCKSLRQLEDDVQEQIKNRIDIASGKTISFEEYYNKYISTKKIKRSTMISYNYIYNHRIKDFIGGYKLSDISEKLIEKWVEYCIIDGIKPSSVRSYFLIVYSVLDMAESRKVISFNPAKIPYEEFKDKYDSRSDKRKALTPQQQKKFMDFVSRNKTYSKYYPLYTFMLNTGMRIGECFVLTWDDVDFEQKFISVKRTFIYKNTSCYFFQSPKSYCGVRDIPITDEVCELLRKIKNAQPVSVREKEVEGLSGFVFLFNSYGTMFNCANFDKLLINAVAAYNKAARAMDIEEMPQISSHIFRHTFCARLCENCDNLRFIQEVMGHADINTTMQYYAEFSKEGKSKQLKALQDKGFGAFLS